MKAFLIIEIDEDGWPSRRRDKKSEGHLTRDQQDTWDTIYGAYKAAQRATGMMNDTRIAVQREQDARAAEEMLRGNTPPQLRSISRRLA
jgi:hypothetical protein